MIGIPAGVAGVIVMALVLLAVPGRDARSQDPRARDARTVAPAVGPVTGARIVEVEIEPADPSFGQLFRLHVTARLPRRSGVSVIDTLGPTNAFRSAGPGRLEEGETPADSVEVQATFPVLPLQDGRRELPGLLIRTGGARSAPGTPDVPERIALGSVEVAPLVGVGSEGSGSTLRPPADVVGGSWSIWAVLAAGILALGAVGAGRIVLRGRTTDGSAVSEGILDDPDRTLNRQGALERLDEIRATGWHRNGRLDDFYRASTDTLRRFLEGRNPSWGADLTSTELLDRIEERWETPNIEALRPAVDVAESVKFGGARPPADRAEGDWKAIRRWIEAAP